MVIIHINERTDKLIQYLVNIWYLSVKSTHDFLSEEEILKIKEYVPKALMNVHDLIVACIDGKFIGFMGVEKHKIEMLFIDPKYQGKGVDKRLINYGKTHFTVRDVCVNEQNFKALKFYENCGFKIYKRSELDEQGQPYPILFLE